MHCGLIIEVQLSPAQLFSICNHTVIYIHYLLTKFIISLQNIYKKCA